MITRHDRSPTDQMRRTRLLALGAVFVTVCGSAWCVWRASRPTPLDELPPVDLALAPAGVKAAIERELGAVRSDPRSGQAWGRLGLVLRAHEFGSEANVCLATACRLEPREFLWAYIAGVSLSITDADAAIACFQRAAALRSREALPHFRLAELLLQQQRTDDARREFEQALALEPESARGHLGLARCALLQGDLAECRRLAVEAAKLSPRQPAPHELLVQIFRRLGDETQANDEQRILSALHSGETTWDDPYVARVLDLRRDPAWLAKIAQSLLDEGRPREAVTHLEDLIASDDADPDWTVLLARALIATKELGRAAEVIEAGIARHPESTDLQMQSGVLAFLKHDWRKAAGAFREAIRMKPNSSQAHYNLGHVLRRLDDREGAMEAFREAIRLQPDLAAAHANLGELLVKAGHREEGLASLRRAVTLDPNDAAAQRSLKDAE